MNRQLIRLLAAVKMQLNYFMEHFQSDRFRNIISLGSAAISLVSLYFSRKSWSDTYRPIVTVRVATNTSGSIATTLNLVVENLGNRPAKNIKLSVDSNKLKSALLKSPDNINRKFIERCFADETIIPLLANGQSISNSFGCLNIQYETSSLGGMQWNERSGEQSDWKPDTRLDIQIKYQDLNGKSYQDRIPILIANDQAFAGSSWNEPITS
jgi:hypothetical protein